MSSAAIPLSLLKARQNSPAAQPRPRPAGDAPPTVTLQPVPVEQIVVYDPVTNVTAITLIWDGGDERWCRLCPREACGSSDRGVCTRLVRGHVSEADASSFRTAPLPPGR